MCCLVIIRGCSVSAQIFPGDGGDAVLFQGATERINMVNRFPVLRHCGLTTHILFTDKDADKQGYSSLKWYRDVAYRLNR